MKVLRIISVITIAILISFNSNAVLGEVLSGGNRDEVLDVNVLQIHSPEELAKWLVQNFEYVMKIPDKPQTVNETLSLKTGDCDDFANLASFILTRLNVKSHVLILKYKNLNMRHAICIWQNQNGFYSFLSNHELIHTNQSTLEDAVKKFYPDCVSITR